MAKFNGIRLENAYFNGAYFLEIYIFMAQGPVPPLGNNCLVGTKHCKNSKKLFEKFGNIFKNHVTASPTGARP